MKELAAALVAAQAEMPAVDKDAVNPHFRSKFTSLDHLIAKTRPVLSKHGLAITQWPTSIDGLPALRTKVTHTSGESDEDTMLLLLGKQDMQGLGGAITYAKRYMWAAVCAVSTDEDDDGNQASSNALSSPAAAPVRQEGAASTAPSDPPKPKPQEAVSEEDLLLLVADKGGDVSAFKAALETARGTAEFPAWLVFQLGHWTKAKKPFTVPAKAKTAAA